MRITGNFHVLHNRYFLYVLVGGSGSRIGLGRLWLLCSSPTGEQGIEEGTTDQ